MDGGAWWATVHGVAKSRTRLSNSTTTTDQMVKNLPIMQETWVLSQGQEDPLEKGKATQPNVLAWRIPWTEEPGGLQSTGSQRVGLDRDQHTHT